MNHHSLFPLRHAAAGAAALLLALPAGAQTLYSEGFDSEAAAKVKAVPGANTEIAFVDYSNFTVGGTSGQNVPEAPHQVAGSAARRGVLMRQTYAGTDRIANLFLTESPNDGTLSFSGNYRLKYDMYLSLASNATTASTGTTELGLWAVGVSEGLLIGRANRGSILGTLGWIATDGGFTTEDCSLVVNATGAAATTYSRNDAGDAGLFTTAFPGAAPIAKNPNNQWVAVEVTVLDGTVTVKYNGVTFHERASSVTTGGIALGYEDPVATSNSFAPDKQWMLIDNVVVETASSPLILVTQPEPFVTATSADPVTADIVVQNLATAPFDVTAATFSGANAASFTVTTPLPVQIPAGDSRTLTLSFTPSGANGVKTASLELATTLPGASTYLFAPVQARKSIATSQLLARYKLDELSGTTLADSSGNNTPGGLQIRDNQIAFGNASLLGDAGFAIGFTPANSSTTGSYATSPVVNTPSFTFSAWIKPSASTSPTANRTLFNRDPDFSALDKISGMVLTPAGNLRVRLRQTTVLETTDAPIVDGSVYHVVLTHKDDDGFGNDTAIRTRLYINGVMVAEKTGIDTKGIPDYPFSATVTAMHIASRTAAGTGFSGDMDDIQLYSTEIAPWQVASMYSVPGITALEATAPELKVTEVAYDRAAGKIDVIFRSIPGTTYTVLTSTDLQTWTELTANLPSAGETSAFSQTGLSSTEPARYYKIRLNP